MVKKLPSGCRERLQAEALTPAGCQRGSSRAAGLRRFLFVLEGEPVERILSQPGGHQLAEISQVVAIFLISFTCSPRKRLSRKSESWESAQAESRACRPKRASFRFFSMTAVASRASAVLPPSHWNGFCTVRPGRGHSYRAGFVSSGDARSPHFSPRTTC